MIKYFSALVIFFLAIAGCSDQKEKAEAQQQKIIIKTINENDLAEIIKNRGGKALFLNIWATWCVPCVEEFPAIVQLHKNYKNRGIEIIAVSVDLPEEAETKIIPFLTKQNAEFKVVVADEKSSEKIIEMLNPGWSGAIPASFIFDKNGNQLRFFSGAQSYEQMSSGIDSVIAL
jgi:thiol-disulfide isomerase/thioredoxin